MRREHSIELRVLLGLPEIKHLIKKKKKGKQLVTTVKTKGSGKALKSKSEAQCPIRSEGQQTSKKKNKNIPSNKWNEKGFGRYWGYGVENTCFFHQQ